MIKSRLIFDKEALRKDLFDRIAKEQTERLIAYAKEKIQEIGEYISTMYDGNSDFDTTGNLLDSLCWGVSFDGSLVEGGFYREKKATRASWLHAWSYAEWNDKYLGEIKHEASEDVNGHELAAEYIERYGNNGGSGWKVFFAILAPYWGYLEKGFNFKGGGGNSGIPRHGAFMRFAVMTHFYDVVKKDLKPARTRFRISVNKYASKSLYRTAKKDFYGR